MDILYFIKILLRRKWLIIGCTILAMVVTFFLTWNMKGKYQSTAEIATGFTMADQVGLTDQRMDVYTTDLKFDNLIQTLNSTQVINLLAYKLILHDLNHPDDAFHHLDDNDKQSRVYKSIDIDEAKKIYSQKLQSMQLLSSYNPHEKKLLQLLKLYDYDPESLQKMLTVYRLSRTDYINVIAVSDNPFLSAFIANNLVSEFNRFYTEYISQRSENNMQMLDTLVQQKKASLEEKQAMLDRVMSGGSEDVVNANVGLIKDYQAKLTAEQSDLNSAKIALAAVNRQLDSLDAKENALNNNNSDIISLNDQLSDLRAKYINGGSKDEALRQKIQDLRTQLQNKYAASSSSSSTGGLSKGDLTQKKSDLEVKIQSDRLDISSLETKIQQLSGNVRSSASRDVTMDALKKQVDQASTEYSDATEKYNTALSTVSQSKHFKQILIGQPALTPESSKRFIFIGLAGVGALLLCIVIIVFLEYIDLSIKTPSFFYKLTGLKIMSVVNKVDLNKHAMLEIISRESAPEEKRNNTFKELLRKLRSEVEESHHQVLLFTSAESQQGKTTLIQALAFSLSLSKKRVLLIDTNFCNNDLTVQLGAKPTLENFSIHRPEIDAKDLEKVISPTDMKGVDAIGCTGGDYTPLEILPKGNLLNYLPYLRTIYDYIFMEAAPINHYTDTRELLGYVDGVVAVFSAEAVIRQVDKTTIEFLQKLNGKFNGVILNKVELENLEA